MTTAAAEFLEMASPSANPGAALSVTSAMTSVGAALDQLARALGHAVTVGRDEVAGIERLVRRVESIRLAVIARVERDRVAVRSGSSNTASWVSQATRSGGGVAAGQVALATALESGLPATRAALAAGEVSTRHAAIIAGAMAGLPVELADAEREKVEASLVRDARRLEPSRLRQTASMALAAAGKGVAEAAAHQEQVLLDQERKAYAASRLTLFDHGDGTTTGRFLVPTGTAMVLRKVLQSMTAPRRDHQRAGTTDRPHPSLLDGPSAGVSAASSQRANGNESPPTLDVGEASAGSVDDDDLPVAEALRARSADWDSLDWHEKHGRAFVDLLEHLPTDRLTGKVASTIVVTMTAEQVFGAAAIAEARTHPRSDRAAGASGGKLGSEGTGSRGGRFIQGVASNRSGRQPETSVESGSGPDVGAARCDTGHLHSTSEARRLACNAGILPAVLGSSSVPLDLGREQRLFTHHQRSALAAVYDACAALGCDRPYAWSELHHLTPWRAGGRTDLKDAIPLCGFHHRRIHDPAYLHRLHTTSEGLKTVRFAART